jgi:hypothetical protein
VTRATDDNNERLSDFETLPPQFPLQDRKRNLLDVTQSLAEEVVEDDIQIEIYCQGRDDEEERYCTNE